MTLTEEINATMGQHDRIHAQTLAEDLGRDINEICAVVRQMPDLKLYEVTLTITKLGPEHDDPHDIIKIGVPVGMTVGELEDQLWDEYWSDKSALKGEQNNDK